MQKKYKNCKLRNFKFTDEIFVFDILDLNLLKFSSISLLFTR